jgi:hypothetical protein
MAERGGYIEYLYWSSRRTDRFLEDNDLADKPVTRTVTSPSLGWIPTFSQSTTSSGTSRPRVARNIEKSLGQIAVSRFDAPGPIHYAKGVSTVVFGEFLLGVNSEDPRQPAVMFTAVDYDHDDRDSVALCLYGSMDNFPEYVQASGPALGGGPLQGAAGWVSSSAPKIYSFIKSHGQKPDDRYWTPEHLAREALKIANGQGICRAFADCEFGLNKPWQRAFTYGDAREAEWFAQIYLDVDMEATQSGRADGFRRVLIGAPLWIRTPDPRAVRLYSRTEDTDVVLDRGTQIDKSWIRILRQQGP